MLGLAGPGVFNGGYLGGLQLIGEDTPMLPTPMPPLHTVAASITYGCSLHYIRLQPPLPTVAGEDTPMLRATLTSCLAAVFDGASLVLSP